MVEEFKIREKIKKKYQLKKIRFDKKHDGIVMVLRSRQPWDEDNYGEFLRVNDLLIRSSEKLLETAGMLQKGYLKEIIKDANKRGDFAEVALVYYPCIDYLIEGTLNKNPNKFEQAIDIMFDAIQACEGKKLGPKWAKEIDKKVKLVKKEMENL